ncbi:MAG: CRTAC1 family protein [Acidobacteria bacterium]|nr:MAG: CRTAC1 family protein [Acidobacteriota bacterium]
METGGGAAFLDYDGDGNLDIYVVDVGGPNVLFRNNGDGTFSDVTEQAGVADAGHISRGVACADYDNDGDEDLYVLNEGPNVLFRNNGDGTFSDVTEQAGVADASRSQSAAFGDYDADGFLDLYVGNYIDMSTLSEDRLNFACQPNRLYHNNGDGTFTDVGAELGVADSGCALAVTFTDYDGDGDLDLLVGNDFGPWGYPPNVLFRNDGPGSDGRWIFTDVSQAAGIDGRLYSMGIAVGDYDNDGDLDYYVTSIGRNVLYRNNGDGTFTDVARETGTRAPRAGDVPRISWGAEFFDYDNDGDMDLYVASGPVTGDEKQANLLFFNRGDGTFMDIAAEVGVDDSGSGRGTIIGDYDGDGDVDLYLVNYGQRAVLYRNEYYRPEGHRASTMNNWLEVKLRGTTSNRDGIGARLRLVAGGRSQIREVGTGSPHASRSSAIVHFGLGPAEVVDRLEIRWPSGRVQSMRDVPVNRRITVIEGP